MPALHWRGGPVIAAQVGETEVRPEWRPMVVQVLRAHGGECPVRELVGEVAYDPEEVPRVPNPALLERCGWVRIAIRELVAMGQVRRWCRGDGVEMLTFVDLPGVS